MAQSLPILVCIVFAAAAIIAVMLAKFKTLSPAANPDAAKRIEEIQKRCESAETNLQTRERETGKLREEFSSMRTELAASQNDLKSARADLVTAREHLAAKDADALIVRTEFATASAQLADSRYNRQKAEEQNKTWEVKYDALTKTAQTMTDRTSRAETQVVGLAKQKQEQQEEIVILHNRLNAKEEALAYALAKQKADEDAAAQFKAVSQELLKQTLTEAKQGVAELTRSLKESSVEELSKHAEKVAQTLEPLQTKLAEYGNAVEGFKTSSHDLFGQVKNQISSLQEAEKALSGQAQALTTALSNGPKVRGNYGEMILKRLVEFAGMQERCHFAEQDVQNTDEGRKIPDMVFQLPGSQKVVVDAKAVVNACADAQNATNDNERSLHLKKHCHNVRARVDELHAKQYPHLYENAVEAVVLFLPAEHLYATAVENDADLTEYAMSKGVIVCGPNALMLLLKVANHLWKQASIEEEAQKIAKIGSDIYKHTTNFLERHNTLGDRIRSLAKAYDESCATLEGRLLSSGRDLDKLHAVVKQREMPDIGTEPIAVRSLRSDEARRILSSVPLLTETTA